MDGRSHVILASLALVGTALTGCIAPGLLQNNAELERSALDARGPAEAAAQAWAPGAALVGIFALESATANDPQPADLAPGNGLAPAWNFAYRSPEGAARAFISFADGTVVAQNDTYGAEAYSDQATPLADLNVDSDAALRAAAADDVFAPALAGENLTLAEGVAHWDGMTGWYFAAISASGGAIAVVDAATGDLLWTEPFELDAMDLDVFADNGFAYRPGPEPLRIEKDGHLDRSKSTEEIPFTLTGFEDDAVLEMRVRSSFPADGVSWRIVKLAENGEDEETIESGATGRLTSRDETRTWEFELDGAGEYRLDLHYRSLTPLAAGGVAYALTLDVGHVPHDDEDADR